MRFASYLGGLTLACTAISGCAQKQDFAEYRELVKDEMRDPASAEFRKEEVRTLWSSSGKRITVYCAEVNSNNAFGGKTGFQPVYMYLSSRSLPPEIAPELRRPWLNEGMNAQVYLNCVRPDTQRADDVIGKLYPGFGGFDQATIDSDIPVLSKNIAPEER